MNKITNPEQYRKALHKMNRAWQKQVRLRNRIATRSDRGERKTGRAIRRSVRAWLPVSWQAQRQYEPKA